LFCINNPAIALLHHQAIFPLSGKKLLALLPVIFLSLEKSNALNFFVAATLFC
jgi:hypothetical protein